jgi:hypothetical protein
LRRPVIRREQPVAQQITCGALPGFVGVAAEVGAHGGDQTAGAGVAQIDIQAQDEVGDFLHLAGNREVGAELLREVHIAAAASLKVRRMRRIVDRRNVENGEFSRFRQPLSNLLAGTDQPLLFILADPIHFALQAGIEQLEIENRGFRRLRMRGNRKQHHQCNNGGNSYHRDLASTQCNTEFQC